LKVGIACHYIDRDPNNFGIDQYRNVSND